MIWFLIPVVAVLALIAYAVGLVVAKRRFAGAKPHSRPQQHAYYALIWVAVPALVIIILAGIFSGPVSQNLVTAGLPEAVQEMEPFRRDAFLNDARLVGEGQRPFQTWEAPFDTLLQSEAARSGSIQQTLLWGAIASALIASVLGGLLAFAQIGPNMR
ncbi:MAG: phosphate ABC transporter permease family protein, partial [Caulobacteraceae bacterium]|nr:phosphate ABC transporter permease family protein [Caulobacteraceae bacterium]